MTLAGRDHEASGRQIGSLGPRADRMPRPGVGETPFPSGSWVWFSGGVTGMLVCVDLALALVAHRVTEIPFSAFDLTGEFNVPTAWNAILLLAITASALAVAVLSGRGGRGWLVCAALTTLMALDEFLKLHERLHHVGALLPTPLPGFAWLLPGGLIGLLLLVLAWRWTGALPDPTRRLLRLAVLLYGAGAVGMEAVGAVFHTLDGAGLAYRLASAAEESLEMGACILATVAILRMLRAVHLPDGRLAVATRRRAE